MRSNVYPSDLKILGKSNLSEPAGAANHFLKWAHVVFRVPPCVEVEFSSDIPKVAMAFAFYASPSGNICIAGMRS